MPFPMDWYLNGLISILMDFHSVGLSIHGMFENIMVLVELPLCYFQKSWDVV